MRTSNGLLLTLAAVLLTLPVSAAAAPFEITTTPDRATLAGSGAEYHSTVRSTSAETPFTASLFLSAESPDLPQATITVSPTLVNFPYGETIVTRVTVSGPKIPGEHRIIITARNGATYDRDTVWFVIRGNELWKVLTVTELGFDPNAPGYTNWASYNRFALDRKRGIGWFVLAGDTLRSFDRTTWRTHPWPEAGPSHAYYSIPDRRHDVVVAGIGIDYDGRLWAGLTGYASQSRIPKLLMMKEEGTWDVHAGPYSPGGIPEGMKEEFRYTLYDGVAEPALQFGPENEVWIKYREGRLYFDGARWHHLDISHGGGTTRLDASGRQWSGYDAHVVLYDGTFWTVWPWSLLGITSSRTFTSVFATDSRGYAWFRGSGFNYRIATDPLDVQVYYPGAWPGDGGTGEILPPENYHLNSWYGRYITAIDIDSEGDVWLGMYTFFDTYNTRDTFDGGVARFHDGRWYHYTYENSGLPNNNVVDLRVDSSRHVWVLTSDGSLTILDGDSPPTAAFNEGVASGVADRTDRERTVRLRLSPNPASSHLIVDLAMPGSMREGKITLYNSLGIAVHRVHEPVLGPGSLQLDVADLPAGPYFIRVEGDSGVQATAPLLITR